MIKTDGRWLKDEHGRTLILRGVNLSGSSKMPTRPNGATWNREDLFEHRDVSFVGRPFPLAEADEHLGRLREWGFNFVRFLITWEAIEHAGPGIYDQEYLDYVRAVIEKANEYGIEVFIDPHQDVWSRFSGGDGAPGWTFDAIGMDITKFKETGAAIVHATHGDPFPRMIWPSNHSKLASMTMWTLFFGGNDFAPETKVDGVPIQEYLQGHYIDAVNQVALRLQGLPNVVGYDTLNEPSAGLIGAAALDANVKFPMGESPTALQAMVLGAGIPQEIDVWDQGWTGARQKGTRLLNRDGVSVWMDGYEPLWKQYGVWDLAETGEPRLLRPNYFSRVGDRQIDFCRDYFRPFANRYAREIRSIQPNAIMFIGGNSGEDFLSWTDADAANIVHAPHWYDMVTLFMKRFTSWITLDTRTQKLVLGSKKVRRTFAEQIARIVDLSIEQMNDAPTLVGEVGIPFDLQNKRAYRTGDFSMQIKALDATMHALETNMVSFTLWNYTPDNTNKRGDLWNDEDLSLFSRDQQTGSDDIHDGGRALEAAVRPYARKVAGEPLYMAFDIKHKLFEFKFQYDDTVQAHTEIFVPNYQYPNGYTIDVVGGTYETSKKNQTLTYYPTSGPGVHTIRVRPRR